MSSSRDAIIHINEIRTFVPSYDQPPESDAIEEPSSGQKFVESLVTAVVWTGVLITLPVSYFWVFKKTSKNEQILIRRLGRLHSVKSGRVATLPIIDTETRADMSLQKLKLSQKELFTIDKCCILVGGEVEWRLHDPIRAYSNSADYKKLAADEFDVEIQRQVSKTFIRELATEKFKVERKLIVGIQMNVHKIGVKIENIRLTIIPSSRQPFLNPGGAGEPMPGIGGTVEKINNSSTTDMVGDFLKGMGDHPGFANILSSMVQTVGDIHQANVTEHDQADDQETDLSIDQIIQLLKLKQVRITTGSIVMRLSDGDVLMQQSNVHAHSRGQHGDCIISAQNQVIVRIIKKQLSYQAAFANGQLSVEGDVRLLQQLLAFL